MASGPTEAAVLEALRSVMDPELHKDLVSLGMVKKIEFGGERLFLDIELGMKPRPYHPRRLRTVDVRAGVLGSPGAATMGAVVVEAFHKGVEGVRVLHKPATIPILQQL